MSQINKIELLSTVGERPFNHLETMKVLKHNYMARMASWGARAFGVTGMDEYNEVKTLFFTVSGHHHKGHVVITLGWNDTYTVRIVKTNWTLVDTYTDVYFDELVELIDKRVERIEAYKR